MENIEFIKRVNEVCAFRLSISPNKENKKTKDMWGGAAAFLSGAKFDKGEGNFDIVAKGLKKLGRIGGLSMEDIAKRIAITDPHEAGYISGNGFKYLAQLAAFIGGGNDSNAAKKMDRLMNNCLESSLKGILDEFTPLWEKSRAMHNGFGKFSDIDVTQLNVDLGACIGFKRMIDDPRYTEKDIDAAIEQERAAHVTSHINSCESEMKTVLMAMRLAYVVETIFDKETGEITVNKKERDYMGKHSVLSYSAAFGCAIMDANENYKIHLQGGRFGVTKK